MNWAEETQQEGRAGRTSIVGPDRNTRGVPFPESAQYDGAVSDFSEFIDLVGERFGGVAVVANDEFFAPRECLVKAEPAVFLPDEYTERGKWMDGWESRRRREPGYDWCILRLGATGVVRGVVVDTAHFKGNYPEQCSIEGALLDGNPSAAELQRGDVEWIELLPKSDLAGDSQNKFEIRSAPAINHLRLNIFPDGGVARLRVHGEPVVRWGRLPVGPGWADLAAALHGGRVVACSDMFFGPRNNLIMPGDARHMGEGWETRRRRGPGNDWVIIRLGARGIVRAVELDTTHFKGNAPARCKLSATRVDDVEPGPDATWWTILEAPLNPHTKHLFLEEIVAGDVASHVRVDIYPDGGVARLRLHGEIPESERLEQGVRFLDALPAGRAERDLLTLCGSKRFASSVAAERPFGSFVALETAVAKAFDALSQDDWLEAFAAHPRIGERKAGGDAHARWSRSEQSGAAAASAETLAELERVNREYEAKHGFVFLICATGKSADEMLAAAKARLGSDRSAEIRTAAEEQKRITALRLRRLLTS